MRLYALVLVASKEIASCPGGHCRDSPDGAVIGDVCRYTADSGAGDWWCCDEDSLDCLQGEGGCWLWAQGGCPTPTCYHGGAWDADAGECACQAGFYGAACEIEVNECDTAGCPGDCLNLVNDFKCICDAEHTGTLCEKLVTTTSTGCACFDDPTDFSCACCAEGACQCGGIASDTCAFCQDTEACASVVRQKQLTDPDAVDDDILTETGCPCFFDNMQDCACCKPGRCQCHESASTLNFATVDLRTKCVPCSADCNDRWVDRSLDGSWVVHYPEPNEGQYGEMVWQVTGTAIEAHFLSGLLPGVGGTTRSGTVQKVEGVTNMYTVAGIHDQDEWGNVPAETVTVSADGLTLAVLGHSSDGSEVAGCVGAQPGTNCLVGGTEGDGSFRVSESGCPCWWDLEDTSCACCTDGGCGCGGPQDDLTAYDETEARDTCVPCSKHWRCNPQETPQLVEARTTYRCAANHFGISCDGTQDEQPLVVEESYLDYTQSRTGCPSHGDASIDGACCYKGGSQCVSDPLHHVSPNLCVPNDAPQRCVSENVIATWKVGQWNECSQPCVGLDVNGDRIVGTQIRTVQCSDQWYNVLDDADCVNEERIDKYAGDASSDQFPTKDENGWAHWFGGAGDLSKRPVETQTCNPHRCVDFSCYKTPTQRLVSIEAYGASQVYVDHTTDENSADDTCESIFATCADDAAVNPGVSSSEDCRRCLPGGCQCTWEPVRHLCVSCAVGGSACISHIPDADPFFQWEEGTWGACDKVCEWNGDAGVQHRVVTCKGQDGGAYADSRCDLATMPARTQTCNDHPCADEYTETLTGCTCWFDLSSKACGCCKPGADGSAGCQISTPEDPSLEGCDHCPGAPPQTPRPSPAPTPLPTPEPTLSLSDQLDADAATTTTTTTTTTAAPGCWSVGDRVMIIPGTRYADQSSACGTIAATQCDGDDTTAFPITFDDGYGNSYEFQDYQTCTVSAPRGVTSAACWEAWERVMLVPGSRYDGQSSGACGSVPSPTCRGAGYAPMTFDNGYWNMYEFGDYQYCDSERRLGAPAPSAPAAQLTQPARKLQQLDDSACMMCIAGVNPELSDCNPANARYLGHAECCLVWATAFDKCDAHCPVSTAVRKLATCDKLIIGAKSEDECDACLESKQAGSAAGSDCGVWKNLLPQCAGPCEAGHKGYAACSTAEPVDTPLPTADQCRRCVLSQSPDVPDCIPDSNGNVYFAMSASGAHAECCQGWGEWLTSCAADCPHPTLDADSCDLGAIMDANLVSLSPDLSAAESCEQCVQRQQDGPACVSAPTEACCSSWEAQWAATCQFQCGTAGMQHVRSRFCTGATGLDGPGVGLSAAPVVALLGVVAA